MGYFMPQHRSQLILILGHLQQTGIDPDAAARQGKGVDLGRIEQHDLPGSCASLVVRRDRPGSYNFV